MKIALLLTFFISANAFSCGEPAPNLTEPFAVLPSDDAYNNMSSYELNFLVKDAKEEDFYMRGITATVDELFYLDVRYAEQDKYEGDYYSTYLTVNRSLEDKVEIVVDYNGADKEGGGTYLCGNFRRYELAKLLAVKRQT